MFDAALLHDGIASPLHRFGWRISIEPSDPITRPLADDEPVIAGGVTLLNLEHRHCRWIIGKDEDDEIRYCGCQRLASPPKGITMYCEAHTLDASQKHTINRRTPRDRLLRVAAPYGGRSWRTKPTGLEPRSPTDLYQLVLGVETGKFNHVYNRAKTSSMS